MSIRDQFDADDDGSLSAAEIGTAVQAFAAGEITGEQLATVREGFDSVTSTDPTTTVGGVDVSELQTRNAARQALRRAAAHGASFDIAELSSALPERGPVQVGPGGAAEANEKPGVQEGEMIEITTPSGTIQRQLPDGTTGLVRLGDVVDVPAVAQDTPLFIEDARNYQPDTAGDEVAAGTEGTAGDALADLASRLSRGQTNDGDGPVDSSGGLLDVDEAAVGIVGLVVLLVAAVVGWSS